MKLKNLKLKKIDWILYSLIVLICFLSFQQGDLGHTVHCTFNCLRGHFSDFYEVNDTSSYLIPTYLIMSVWGFLLKTLGLISLQEIYPSIKTILLFKVLTTFAGAPGTFYFK